MHKSAPSSNNIHPPKVAAGGVPRSRSPSTNGTYENQSGSGALLGHSTAVLA